MLAEDRFILAAPIANNDLRNPTRLEILWAKRTCTVVNRSKADATAAIQRTHEQLTSHFRYYTARRRKLLILHNHRHIQYTLPPHTNPTRQSRIVLNRYNTPPTLHTTFQLVLRHLGAVAKGTAASTPSHNMGAESIGAFYI